MLKFEHISEEINHEIIDYLQDMKNLESLSFASCESTQLIFENVRYHFPCLKVLGVKDRESPKNDEIRDIFGQKELIIIRS